MEKRKFFTYLIGLIITNIIYIVVSRWYSFPSSILHETFSFYTYMVIYLILFLGITTTDFRFLINLSMFFVSLTLNNNKKLLSPTILYVLGEEDSSSSGSNKSNSDKRFSFINIDRSRSYYRSHFDGSHAKVYRGVGMCIGLCAILGTGFAAYYTKIQAESAQQ